MRIVPLRLCSAGLIALASLAAVVVPVVIRAGDDRNVPDRSPIALAVSADGKRLLSANQTSGSVSLVDLDAGRVLDELKTGEKPAGVAISRDGRLGIVAHWYGGEIAVLGIQGNKLAIAGRVEVGPEPRGVVLSRDGKTAYVAIGVANEVARVDLARRAVTGRLTVEREPRNIAISADDKTLIVGCARGRSVAIIDVPGWKVARTIPIDGENLRQVALSADGKQGYVANMRNRRFPTTRSNIDLGWVLGQRLTRFGTSGSIEFETLTLDTQGKAASDAHGVAISQDGRLIAVSCGGTHEVMIFRTDGKPLPWRMNSSRDLIAPELLRNDGRYRRVNLGGRPTELAFGPDSKTLYVANYLENAIQVVDADSAQVVRSIALGGPKTITLARKGEMLFHAAERSFNQWYSCNTCHSDGHTNGLDFDTLNDGWQDRSTFHERSRKKVPTLRGTTKTGPWTWHGWQKSLDDAMVESFTKSMQGSRPSSEDVRALVAYLGTLEYPPNPHRNKDGSLPAAAVRGREVFRSPRAACNTCHGGEEFTDGKIHEVGLEVAEDRYRGYNPPSLKGLYDKDPYLHDGRAKTLREILTGDHSPEKVTGLGSLSEQELNDLLAYLKCL